MKWFKRWKKDVQKELRAEVLLEQLHFLANDFVKGNARAVDYAYWIKYIDELTSLCTKKDVALIGAVQAYELLLEQFKKEFEFKEQNDK